MSEASTWTERLLHFPISSPRITLGVVLALTLVLGFFATSVRVDSSVENLLPTNDPDRAYYDDVRTEFGGEDASVVGVFAEDVFAPESLARIDQLSTRLAAIDGVREVLSLTNVKGVESTDEGIRIGPLMRELPETRAAAAELRRRVMANPLYIGNLVSADGTATGVLVQFDALSDEEFRLRGIEEKVRREVEAVGGGEFAITGLQTLKANGAMLMERDLFRFVPGAVILVLGVLLWEFRTWRGALLPLGTVLIGLVWTLGCMGLAGDDINMGTLVLPPLLIATGVAYSIHVVSRYYSELAPGLSRAEVVTRAVEHGRLPVAIAATTTVVGFSTLMQNPIDAIRDLGLYSVIGISTIFLLTVIFLPAALTLLREPRSLRERPRDGWVSALLERIGNGTLRHRRAVLAVAGLVAVVSLWGASRIRVETDYLRFFDESSRIRVDNTRIAERLGGTQPIYLVVEGGTAGAVSQVDVLEAIRDTQEFVASLPLVDSSLSLVDYFSLMQRVLNPESEARLPATQSAIEQILLFADPADIRPVANSDFSRANIIVRTRLSGSAEVAGFVQQVEDFAADRFPRGVDIRATGTMVLLNHSADTLAYAQLAGLAQVLLVLLVLMSLLFLSLRVGFLSLIPNTFPIIVLFGLMGWSGIPLNVSTSMIAVMAIGIALDDTIHYLSEFNTQLRRTGDQGEAVLQAARCVGRPIVFTSIALTAGFLIVCLSNFQPIRYFGLLASASMAIALVGDLVLTPALLMTTSIVTLWDVLFVKLGPEPHKEVPLFNGLRPLQAKVVVLMARIAAVSPGTFITRYGEMKPELYVLLSGRVDVCRQGGEQVLRSLGRGAVIGEMGLVRQRPRSADVIAREPSEYLVLDSGFLHRIQVRHPRIAARVFLNLTRILSDRLESTTDLLAKSGGHHLSVEATMPRDEAVPRGGEKPPRGRRTG